MSKRLQVVVDEVELRAFERAARRRGLTLSEWVRQQLRAGERQRATSAPDRKLAAIRTAAGHAFPTGEVADMLAEIERGYQQDVG
jgi:hypothetical protein